MNKSQQRTDLLELAWGIIANAGSGDWERESKEWQDAAIRWRDIYFGSLKRVSKASSELPNSNRPPECIERPELQKCKCGHSKQGHTWKGSGCAVTGCDCEYFFAS